MGHNDSRNKGSGHGNFKKNNNNSQSQKEQENILHPYNFISMCGTVERKEPQKGPLTGVIECTLRLTTPAAFPDSSMTQKEVVLNNQGGQEEHKREPVFKIGDDIVITGSELRGVIRSSFEVLSNSCFSVYNDAKLSGDESDKSISDLLGDKKSCDDPDNLCPACALFGMTGNDGAVSSRLRFADAIAATDEVKEIKNVTLNILGGPDINAKKIYFCSKGSKIRGRKFYFHHRSKYSDDKKSNQNITTDLVDKGAEFQFEIYFDHITDDELRQLAWAICLGENDIDGKLQHKIGHGKPLGLGSCKMIVESIFLRTFDSKRFTYDELSYPLGFLDDKRNIPFDSSSYSFKDYMKIVDFSFADGMKVAYRKGQLDFLSKIKSNVK